MRWSLRRGTRAGRFRVGATSFVYPGGWAANVERLGERVDDIELLFLEAAAFPSEAECRALAHLKERFGLSYCLHTPLDIALASPDESVRRRSLSDVIAAIDAGCAVSAEHVIVHLCPTRAWGAGWKDHAEAALETIAERAQPSHVLVETLDGEVESLETLVLGSRVGICLDVGHFVRDGLALRSLLGRLLPHSPVVQWHGTDERDHRSLAHFPDADGYAFVRRLVESEYDGIVTLEVFRRTDFEISMETLGGWLDRVAMDRRGAS